MHFTNLLLLGLFIALGNFVTAQNRGVQMITGGGTASFRGMSIPSERSNMG